MWSSFVTGFATQASKLIEDRDKEIQKQIDEQLELMNEEAKATQKKGQTRRDTLKTAANQLISLGMPQEQVAAFISGADQATLDATIKLMQKQATTPRGMTPEMSQQMLSQFPKTEETPEDVIERLSTPVAGAEPQFKQMRGAFGLPSPAAREATARTAGLRTTLPEMPMATTALDFGVFAEEEKPKGVVELEGKLADEAEKAGVSVEEYIKTDAGKKIYARIVGRTFLEAARKSKDEEVKDRSTEAIRKLVSDRLQQEITPLEFNNAVVFDPSVGDFVVTIPGTEDAKRFQERRSRIVQQTFRDTGILDAEGKIIGGRNAADALNRYAIVDYDKLRVKSWRDSPLQQKQEPAAPTSPAPAAPATPSATSAAPATKPVDAFSEAPSDAARVERLRADANAKIAQSPALAARVRAEFKKETGQDL
jgi:hypothetical protein